jgi:hypothetical protein
MSDKNSSENESSLYSVDLLNETLIDETDESIWQIIINDFIYGCFWCCFWCCFLCDA